MLNTPEEREHRGKTSSIHISRQKEIDPDVRADTIKFKKINDYLLSP